MSKNEIQPELSQAARDALQSQLLRVKSWKVAAMVWDRVLTPQERRKLGENAARCHRDLGTVGMWREVRGGSETRAVIDIAHQVGLMDETTRLWLLREAGEQAAQTVPQDRPTWCRDTGKLCRGDRVLRRLRPLQNPSNMQVMLDAFQSQDWPYRIANPLSLGQQQLHETVRHLNKGLEGLRFHGQEGGGAVTWEWA
ncbi:MAG: hypothetical protein ACYC35_25210 [Pirellulales bacterium]